MSLLETLLALLAAGYVAIDVFFIASGTGAPAFLFVENIVYAAAYSAILLVLRKGGTAKAYRGIAAALTVLAFNTGRVSRSVVSPQGQVGRLALEHIPLLALLSATTLVALATLIRAVEEGRRT